MTQQDNVQGNAEPVFTVTVRENGPLLVKGDVTVRKMTIVPEGDHYLYQDDGVLDHDEMFGLCRCGKSATPPFCDKAHAGWFDGTETASREPYRARAKRIEGQGLVLLDDFDMCALARFCHTDKGKVWEVMKAEDDPQARELAIRAADECPAGRLVALDAKTGDVLEGDYPNEIVALEDPQAKCSGPLWVRGDFDLVAADGHIYEKRTKLTLCRCGHSQNKPLCDCKHYHEHWFAE